MKNTFPQSVIAAAFWLACFAVATLSLLPVAELPHIALNIWDKVQHASGFAVLGVLGLWAYPKWLARVCIGLLLFGAAIELAQAATGWRTGDPLDWIADAVGIAVSAIAMRLTTAPRGRASRCATIDR